MTEWAKVGKKKDFSSDGAFGVKVGEANICLVRLGGKYYALDDRCTHAEAMLSAGEVEDGEVMCPLHGARFNLGTGEAVTPPATVPVKTHEVKVEGDDVLVRLSDVPAAS
jgi:3-phenylpropionate/trans-cinnamate dioxygenase ferredoxin component